ncbi:MAG: hypothetical protein ABIR28_11970 [Vicinamibacteria bacterium]
MKSLRVLGPSISLAALIALPVIALPARAVANSEPWSFDKPDKPQKSKPEKQKRSSEPRREGPPAARAAKPAHPGHPVGQERAEQVHQRNALRQHRAGNFEAEHRTWTQRGGYKGSRIPERTFTTLFGPSHAFRVDRLPFTLRAGSPSFQYNGYWVASVDPYPEYWAEDWYATDDLYVDYYNDGYYLYNRRYSSRPGVAITISF